MKIRFIFAANQARNGTHFQYHSWAAGRHLLHPSVRRNRRLCGRDSFGYCLEAYGGRTNLSEDRCKDQLRRRRGVHRDRHLQRPPSIEGGYHNLYRLHCGLYRIVHRRLRPSGEDGAIRPAHAAPADQLCPRRREEARCECSAARADREHPLPDLCGTNRQDGRGYSGHLHGWRGSLADGG